MSASILELREIRAKALITKKLRRGETSDYVLSTVLRTERRGGGMLKLHYQS